MWRTEVHLRAKKKGNFHRNSFSLLPLQLSSVHMCVGCQPEKKVAVTQSPTYIIHVHNIIRSDSSQVLPTTCGGITRCVGFHHENDDGIAKKEMLFWRLKASRVTLFHIFSSHRWGSVSINKNTYAEWTTKLFTANIIFRCPTANTVLLKVWEGIKTGEKSWNYAMPLSNHADSFHLPMPCVMLMMLCKCMYFFSMQFIHLYSYSHYVVVRRVRELV